MIFDEVNNFDEVNEIYPIVDEFYCKRVESWCGDDSDCNNCPLIGVQGQSPCISTGFLYF